MTPIRLCLGLALGLLAGCGGGSAGSGLNPFGWFGGANRGVVLEPEGGFGQVEDSRDLVAEVTQLSYEPVVGGAVLHAVGLPAVQGYWDGDLIEVGADPPEAGVLVLEFRIRPPQGPTRVSTPQSREVSVGHYLSNIALAGLGEIRVVGAGNSRSVRR